MITINDEAAALILDKNDTIYLDMPKTITSCCFDFQDCPTVRLGTPADPLLYDRWVVRNINVFVPHRMPDMPIEIAVRSFLGIRSLVIKGWKLI